MCVECKTISINLDDDDDDDDDEHDDDWDYHAKIAESLIYSHFV